MQDDGKYIRLFGTLFFTFIGFIVAMILVLLGLRVFFGLLSFVPGITTAFTLFIISVPAALFISVYLIYIRRTKQHPSAGARIFSFMLLAIALAAWAFCFVSDLITFFKHYYTSIAEYYSYDMIFLVSNVVCLFIIAMVQALAVKKETDWMERKRDF